AEPQTFLDRLGDQARVADQLPALVVVGIEQVERAAGGTAGRRQRRAADAENLVEQLAVAELVAGVAGVDEIADEVRARADATLVDDDLDLCHGAVEGAAQLLRPRLARLDVGGARNEVMERDEDRLPPR